MCVPCTYTTCDHYHKSLITGIFPKQLKIAKVIPLNKKTTNWSKFFEKSVYNQLYAYFTTNKLFHEGQYGLRGKHSTELANMEFLEIVLSAVNDKKLPVSIFMDLSKAFDTLDHKSLWNKFKYHGVNGTPLCWLMSYLSNRTEYVEINNVISSRSTISTGVPQGSILGPLLFLIYMNDRPCASNLFHCFL